MLLGPACGFEIPASAPPQPVLARRVLHRVSDSSHGSTPQGERRKQYFDDILASLDKNGSSSVGPAMEAEEARLSCH